MTISGDQGKRGLGLARCGWDGGASGISLTGVQQRGGGQIVTFPKMSEPLNRIFETLIVRTCSINCLTQCLLMQLFS
jgi:hypothetical protein